VWPGEWSNTLALRAYAAAKGRSWVRVEDGRIQGTRVAWVARRERMAPGRRISL